MLRTVRKWWIAEYPNSLFSTARLLPCPPPLILHSAESSPGEYEWGYDEEEKNQLEIERLEEQVGAGVGGSRFAGILMYHFHSIIF